MTAELIVMNKNGLALAADSAVSISSGGSTSKVYNTANKLFTLSKYRPVGVMIYGSAEIMGLPWEIVIKRYRELLSDKSFTKLSDYSDDFFKYLKEKTFPPHCYIGFMKQRSLEFFRAIMNEVDNQVEKEIEKNGGIDEEKVESLHTERISNASEEIKSVQKRLNIKTSDISNSKKKYRDLVKKRIEKLLENRPVKGAAKRQLIDSCLLATLVFPGASRSGLVIAGFGDDDLFPSAKAFEIHKILDGNVYFDEVHNGQVTLSNKVNIRAFAQTNETQSFMNGISARLGNYLVNDAAQVLTNSLGIDVTDLLIRDGIVAEEKRDECIRCLGEAGKGMHEYLKDSVDNISRLEFSGPVVGAVSFFSPTEMAAMAETLVSLESFRQQVTLRSETVGGPIDVAVITRGDGFIWIKRKHYFTRDLNHQFFTNYNRTTGAHDEDTVD